MAKIKSMTLIYFLKDINNILVGHPDPALVLLICRTIGNFLQKGCIDVHSAEKDGFIKELIMVMEQNRGVVHG